MSFLRSFLQYLTAKYAQAAIYSIAIVAFQIPVQSYAHGSLPQLGDGAIMSLADERKLGDKIAREIYRDPDYLDDPLLVDYLQRIWQPLLAAARKRGDLSPEQERQLAWELVISKDRSVNAFALPGGYFGIHLGLIAITANKDELASVLAHEITHVSQRHLARQFSKQEQQTPWLIAATILGMLAASKNAQVAQATVMSAQAVGAQNQLNFSRDMEREADRMGFSLMQSAGFDVRGFVGMFDKLQGSARLNDSGNFPYLRSHPLGTERIGDMQSRLQLESFDAAPRPSLAAQAEHALMTERARLLSDPRTERMQASLDLAERSYLLSQAGTVLIHGERSSATASTANTVGAALKTLAQLYGGAVAAVQLKQYDVAIRYAHASRAALSALQKFMIFESESSMEYAQAAIESIVIEAGIQSQGSEKLSPHLLPVVSALSRWQDMKTRPQARALLFVRTQWLLSLDAKPELGSSSSLLMDALQQHLVISPRDAQAWNLLSQLQAQRGLRVRSLRSSAEAQWAQFDPSGALERLRAAQEAVREDARAGQLDHVQASIIDTRTRQVQALVREQHNERSKLP